MTTEKVERSIEDGPTSSEITIRSEIHFSGSEPTLVVTVNRDNRPPISEVVDLTEELWWNVLEDHLVNLARALKIEIPPGVFQGRAAQWHCWLGIGQRVQAGANKGGHKKAISIRKRNQKWRDMAEDLYKRRPGLSVYRAADLLADRVKANPDTVRKVISKKRPGPGLD